MTTEKPPIRLFQKQKVAWDYLHDSTTRELAYGGGAGGGKSLLGSLWLATQIANKPGSTWCIARSELKKIKLSTLITFRKILKDVGFSDDSYKYDDQKSTLKFSNGCLVVLMDLNENPSDPNYDRLGSTEFSGAFIDEAQETTNKAKNVLLSRLRNLTGETFYYSKNKKDAEKWIKNNKKGELHYNSNLDEYEVVMWKQEIPKLLLTLNPGRNFVYTDFYKPRKKGTLLEYRQFVQSLPTDNVFLPEAYIESLKTLDKVSKERLLYGNFDYVEDDALLFNIDEVSQIFKQPKKTIGGEYFITVDAARQGRDNTIICIWEGLHCFKVIEIKKATLTDQADTINSYISQYNVDIDNVIVDEVGVGGGLVDLLNCRGFIANAAPLHPYSAKLLHYKRRNYGNLKTQAFFYLQKYLQEISIYPDCPYKEQIIEEALFIRQSDIDNDNKIKLESKKEVKERLGRSPDFIDAISFRMYYLIKEHYNNPPEENPTPKTQEQIDEEELLAFLTEDEPQEQEEFDISVY